MAEHEHDHDHEHDHEHDHNHDHEHKHEYIDLNEHPEFIEQYIREVNEFRMEKDKYFLSEESPLLPEQKESFSGLKYYKPDPSFRVIAEAFVFQKQEVIEIETNYADRKQPYFRFARLQFSINNTKLELTVYKALDEDYYFLPFKDQTNNDETYGAGRYVEIEPLIKDNSLHFAIDFNFAYNPNCAYNDQWVCPVTPFENHLQYPILAGEKKFDEH